MKIETEQRLAITTRLVSIILRAKMINSIDRVTTEEPSILASPRKAELTA